MPYQNPVPTLGRQGLTINLQDALVKAAAEINRDRVTFSISDGVSVGEWPGHPELQRVKEWLQKRGADADELAVIYWIAVSIRSDWEHLPKRTATEHKELYGRIVRLTDELSDAIDETGTFYYRGGGHGLKGASARNLLTDEEETVLDSAMAASGGINNAENSWAFPSMELLLARLHMAAQRLLKEGPIHGQPSKRGAERGYFVRRLHRVFERRYREAPAEVLAAITTVALDEITDRELVTKLIRTL